MKKGTFTQKEKKTRLEFISSLEQEFRGELDELLRQKNEFQYQKREKELILEEERKKSNPNLSMFSPIIGSEDENGNPELYQSEMEELEKRIRENAAACDAMTKKIVALQELKDFVGKLQE